MKNNKVFISHQHNDDEIANKVISVLENNGIECFADHLHIPDGEDWSKCIEKEFNESENFILINSKNTVGSVGCYVELEWSKKKNKKITVLQFGEIEEDYKWSVLLAPIQSTPISDSNIVDVVKNKVIPKYTESDQKATQDVLTIEEFNKIEISKLKKDSKETYLRSAFNDFIDLTIKTNERISVIKYKQNCGYNDNIYAELINLDSEEINYLYCNSIASVDNAVKLCEPDNQTFIIIKNINEITALQKLKEIIVTKKNVNVIFGINFEQCSDLENELQDIKCFFFDKMSNKETIEYLTQLEKNENINIGGNLKTIFLMPALYDFRTPKVLKIIVNYIKQNCSAYNDSDFNLTDIFDFYDKYLEIETKASEAFEKLIDIAIKKKFNIFTINDIEKERDVLFENELICKKGINYRICNEEYFFHRVAEHVFSVNGSNLEDSSITAVEDSIPYYIYLYYRETNELVLDKFELDEVNMLKLLQLFVSEENALSNIILSRKYDKYIIKFICDANEKGLYDLSEKVIRIIENSKIEPSEEFDYLSPKIEMHYNLTDELLETDEEFGDVLSEKAYICFQTDKFKEAGELFEKAINKMIDNDVLNYKLIFNYIEFLFDFGDYKKIEELFEYVDNDDIKNNDELLTKYYYTKAELDGYHLELASCLDNLEKCINLCEKNVNIGKLQIYYGEKGYYLMYQGKYDEAKKYNQINLDIAKSLGNYNGMVVAAIDLGICELCTKNFNNMYRLFSYAATYAKNVSNYWRYSEALLYLALLIKEKDRIECIDEIISSVDSDIYKTYINILYSYYYFVKKDEKSAKEKIEEAIKYSEKIENIQLKEMAKAWSNFLSTGNVGKIDDDISLFMNDIIEGLKNLKDSETVYKSLLDFYLYKELNTDRLKCRSMKISDIPDIYEYSSNNECTKYVLFNKHKTFNDTAKFLANVYDENNIGTYMCWAVEHKEDKKVIGTIDLLFNEKYKAVEIGYIFNKNYWRKGYCKETVKAILDYCKNVLCLDRLLGVAFEVNEGSRKVLESTGFVEFDKIENYHNKILLKTKNGIAYQYLFDK